MAQHVGLLAPGAKDHMWREVRQMFGKDCVRVKGAIAGDEAQMLLTMLHDHMGTMTVENPDLHHRAARQGLLGKVREMEENGYTIIENAISDDFADEIREAVFKATAPYHRFALQWMLYHGREFELLAQHPQLMTLIDASLGRGAVIGADGDAHAGGDLSSRAAGELDGESGDAGTQALGRHLRRLGTARG